MCVLFIKMLIHKQYSSHLTCCNMCYGTLIPLMPFSSPWLFTWLLSSPVKHLSYTLQSISKAFKWTNIYLTINQMWCRITPTQLSVKRLLQVLLIPVAYYIINLIHNGTGNYQVTSKTTACIIYVSFHLYGHAHTALSLKGGDEAGLSFNIAEYVIISLADLDTIYWQFMQAVVGRRSMFYEHCDCGNDDEMLASGTWSVHELCERGEWRQRQHKHHKNHKENMFSLKWL